MALTPQTHTRVTLLCCATNLRYQVGGKPDILIIKMYQMFHTWQPLQHPRSCSNVCSLIGSGLCYYMKMKLWFPCSPLTSCISGTDIHVLAATDRYILTTSVNRKGWTSYVFEINYKILFTALLFGTLTAKYHRAYIEQMYHNNSSCSRNLHSPHHISLSKPFLIYSRLFLHPSHQAGVVALWLIINTL